MATATRSRSSFTDLTKSADSAAALLKHMGNPHRLMVLCALADQELSVGQMQALTPLSASALSQHLATLRAAGLVTTRRQSQSIFYRVEGNAATRVIDVLKSIFCPQPE